MLLADPALAHETGDPSVSHQLFDSALLPVLGVAALVTVSVIWWRSKPHREQ
jgi:hypothetical protein